MMRGRRGNLLRTTAGAVMASIDIGCSSGGAPYLGDIRLRPGDEDRAPLNSGDHPGAVPARGFRGCGWWFAREPSPALLVDEDGHLLCANPAGETALEEGHLTANGAGLLKFGSAQCDAAFLTGVRAVVGKQAHRRAVLRQRHGGWFGAGFVRHPKRD